MNPVDQKPSEGSVQSSGKQSVAGGFARDAAKTASASGASWRIPLIVSILLIGTSIAGFALTNYAPERASWYWVLILPAFAAVPIWHTWTTIRRGGKTNWSIVRKQIYHWVALLIAIQVLFVLIRNETINGRSGSLVALLLMALTCANVGINFDWVFIVVGAILAMAVLVAALFQEYVWLVMLGLGLAFVVLLLMQWLARRKGTD
ncbi:MAG: hypothetical protein ACLP9L_36285 [Thermoguttaceae bacterium]